MPLCSALCAPSLCPLHPLNSVCCALFALPSAPVLYPSLTPVPPPPEVATVALLQCTSPLTRADDVTRAIGLLAAGRFDSVFSLVRRQPGLLWRETEGGGSGGGLKTG